MAREVEYILDLRNKCGPDVSGRVEESLGDLGILDERMTPAIARRRRHKSSAWEEIEVLLGIFYRDYFVTKSIMNKLGQRMNAKLEHDFGSVRLDRPGSDLQQSSNLLIRLSCG